MKTKQYTAAILVALLFATAAIQAQPTRRSDPKEKKERTTVTRSTREVKPQKARSTQPARTVQSQKATTARKVQRNTATQPSRTVQRTQPAPRKEAPRQVNRQVERRVQKPAVTTQRHAQRQVATPNRNTQVNKARKVERPVSISTSRNPRSAYRKPHTKVYEPRHRTVNRKVNTHTHKRYYGGHHYHYFYPTKRVKIHYHHDTYVHNYRVLYRPAYHEMYWNRHMYREYRRWYPEYRWNYRYGHRIQMMSVFDARYNLGEVAMVYGRVYATWYNRETDDYLLFFGGDFPYQEFTVVLPARVARKFSWRPERFFLGEHITVTGLITTFEGNPEIIVKNRRQVGLY